MTNFKFSKSELDLLSQLEDNISGKSVLVISCGPSMENWREIYDSYSKNEKPFVICIKQSIECVGELCDLLVINEVNLKKYNILNTKIKIVFGLGEYETRNFNFIKRHLTYTVKSAVNLNDSLSGKFNNLNDFERNFVFSPQVNWGPGIMYEFVLPFLFELKPSTITTVGWDIADASGKNTHFNDSKVKDNKFLIPFKSKFSNFKGIISRALQKNSITILLHDKYRDYILRYNYLRGKKVNSVKMMEGEAQLVSNIIPFIRLLAKKNNIELNILTKSTWIKGCEN